MKWWNQSWNPVVGCSHAGSPGCDHCYARDLHERRRQAFLAGKQVPECYARPFGEVRCLAGRLQAPLRWKKPRLVFVNSMSDLFHPDVPDAFIDQVFAVMANVGRHRFIVCTKRARRMREYLSSRDEAGWGRLFGMSAYIEEWSGIRRDFWPLRNVMGLVTVCNQPEADENIPELLAAPLALRGVSVEPMLSGLDLGEWLAPPELTGVSYGGANEYVGGPSLLDWVICGGESGPNARPMHPDWARGSRDQCQKAGVRYFFKQWGEFLPDCQNPKMTGIDPHDRGAIRLGKHRAGRLLDGVEHNGMPEGWTL